MRFLFYSSTGGMVGDASRPSDSNEVSFGKGISILLLSGATKSSSIIEFKEKFSFLAKSRTVIVVAKHLYNLNMCNKLMFLDKNKVAQFGPAGQVLEEEGPAQELLKQQLKVISPHFEKDLGSVLRGLK